MIGLLVTLIPKSHGQSKTTSPSFPVASKTKPGSLALKQAECLKSIDAYLGEMKELVQGTPPSHAKVSGYDWFAIDPVGAIGAEMIPMVLFRILPDLANQYGEKDNEGRPLFGNPGENFAKFGFWPDPRERYKGRPLPMGFSWTPGRAGDAIPLSLTVRTCGGCHTGRVRLDDGSVRILVGAPNTELLLHQYDLALTGFFAKYLVDDKEAKFQEDILKLVNEKSQDPTYFFRGSPGYDTKEEARQVAVFKATLGLPAEQRGVLAMIKLAAKAKLGAVTALEKVAYSKKNSPKLDDGPPGFIDSSGLGIAAFVGPAKLDPNAVLFAGATKNDIPSVWNQGTRKQFQWDGNIRDELARNLVAALGLVGRPQAMDIRGNVFISDFIDGLPPAPYPFTVGQDTALLDRGRQLFEENCAACHQPDQKRGDGIPLPIFNDLGTDTNRARVVTPVGYELIKTVLVQAYQPADLTFTYDGKLRTPNKGIDGDALLIKRFTAANQGYVANPLDGIWARAPYLHNGSVPTLRHLLAPSLRKNASKFVRGAISYDKANVGWVWEADRLNQLRTENPSARHFDTSEDGQANTGHDQASWVDRDGKVGPKDRTYRLSWDDPKSLEVEALLEYLKTF